MFVRLLSTVLAIALWAQTATAETPLRPKLRPVYEPVVLSDQAAQIRPRLRYDTLPNMRWAHLRGTDLWTQSALSVMRSDGQRLTQLEPRDIDRWCPAYRANDSDRRAAFWVGLISTLAKHESTYRPTVSGDGGRSHGLLQIRVPTADFFGCTADSKADLLHPTANLACAIKIMSKTVARDNAVAIKDGRWRGVAADWGPFTTTRKREDMRAWTRRQTYCTPLSSLRPKARPAV